LRKFEWPVRDYLSGGDVLLINPPFASTAWPSLGLHIIETIALNEGLSTSILYANLSLASCVGKACFTTLTVGDGFKIAELFFTSFAFPQNRAFSPKQFDRYKKIEGIDPIRIHETIKFWLESFRNFIRCTNFFVYGLSTAFAQNLSSVCIAKIIREEKPNCKIIIGGANCAGVMSSGVSTICPQADFVFSGESELTFKSFCRGYKAGNFPKTKIIYGQPNEHWKTLPLPNYDVFFEQLNFWLPKSELLGKKQISIPYERISIPYETSRGCWWGQKHHCLFCGLNNDGIVFRQKDPQRVLEDIKQIAKRYPFKKIHMTDNIMPLNYFQDLIPSPKEMKLSVEIFYEQKANLKRNQLIALKNAGIINIQPGIEALSTNLLKLMKKGVNTAQNIATLRDCRTLGINVAWNILYGFPNEKGEDFSQVIAMIPLLTHLDPPSRCSKISFDRFSPYFDHPKEFGIRNLRPAPIYTDIYPKELIHSEDIAYHFVGDIDSALVDSPSLLRKLTITVEKWIDKSSADTRPVLCVAESEKGFVVIDTRFSDAPLIDYISDQTAMLITSNTKLSGKIPRLIKQKKWAIKLDDQLVGLASTLSNKLFGCELSLN